MTRAGPLGRQLGRLVTLSTALALLVFTAVASAVVWLDEAAEAEHPGVDDDVGESPLDDVIADLGLAVAIATPLGLGVAIAGAWWAARRVAARIDALIATASRMTADDLDARLPVSPRGDELDALAAALNALFARIDGGVAALRRFAADASHELRTPLTVMINTLEVASRRPRDVAAWEQVAARTLDELRRTADLVEALLQSARAGAFDLPAEPVELDAELAAIVEHWQGPARAAGVTLAADVRSGAAVRVDPRGLAIAIGNVVANAIAHSPRGGTIAVRATSAGDDARIEIDDDGPGVSPADRARIFAPFVRGEPGSRAGAGLGLAIARRSIEAHGGAIAVEDAPAGGARFVVALPATPAGLRTPPTGPRS